MRFLEFDNFPLKTFPIKSFGYFISIFRADENYPMSINKLIHCFSLTICFDGVHLKILKLKFVILYS